MIDRADMYDSCWTVEEVKDWWRDQKNHTPWYEEKLQNKARGLFVRESTRQQKTWLWRFGDVGLARWDVTSEHHHIGQLRLKWMKWHERIQWAKEENAYRTMIVNNLNTILSFMRLFQDLSNGAEFGRIVRLCCWFAVGWSQEWLKLKSILIVACWRGGDVKLQWWSFVCKVSDLKWRWSADTMTV